MMVDPKAVQRSPIFGPPKGKTHSMRQRSQYLVVDESSPIRLYTDASDYGIGGVLFQVVNDEWKPIAFISKFLSASQINWSTIQKEAYAIFYCCQQLDYLIRDRKFTIHTDHINLTYMKKTLLRW